jgi:hypothetical protein
MNLPLRNLRSQEDEVMDLPAVAGAGGAMTRARAGAGVVVMAAWRMLSVARRQGPVGAAAAAVVLAVVVVAVLGWMPALHETTALQSQLGASQPINISGHNPAGLTASGFAAKLPTRTELPAALAIVYAQAEAAHIQLPRGSYVYVPGKDGAGRYQITLPVQCSYDSLRHFVEGVLAQIPAAALDGVRMQRQDVGDATIDAELEFVIYVRETA